MESNDQRMRYERFSTQLALYQESDVKVAKKRLLVYNLPNSDEVPCIHTCSYDNGAAESANYNGRFAAETLWPSIRAGILRGNKHRVPRVLVQLKPIQYKLVQFAC